ncbi:MAG: hypothetical protein QHH14_03030 [Clostridiales bacterium]|nr:hypothetical protein [Clostridiales bacterium]
MIKDEFIKRSPLRILEESIHGGLGRGNIGVLASRKGVGKTACLVQIATDKLFQQKPVIHVSYSSRVDHIIGWYEDMFREIAGRLNLESTAEVHDDLIKNRVIMNFNQEGTRAEQVMRSLEAMITHGKFAAETIIVDGYNFLHSLPGDLQKFKDFAGNMGLEVWFSASLKGEEPLFDEAGLPNELKPQLDEIDVLITLRFRDNRVKLEVVKDRGYPPAGELKIGLDPATLLIARS